MTPTAKPVGRRRGPRGESDREGRNPGSGAQPVAALDRGPVLAEVLIPDPGVPVPATEGRRDHVVQGVGAPVPAVTPLLERGEIGLVSGSEELHRLATFERGPPEPGPELE